jgi:hypothetical protein
MNLDTVETVRIRDKDVAGGWRLVEKADLKQTDVILDAEDDDGKAKKAAK